MNQWAAAAGAAAARSEGEKVVQDVPSASEDPFKSEPCQETVDYEDDDDMQEAQPQQAVEEHDGRDHVPTSPASSRGMDADETVGVLTSNVKEPVRQQNGVVSVHEQALGKGLKYRARSLGAHGCHALEPT